jgi:chaperone protein EcpD
MQVKGLNTATAGSVSYETINDNGGSDTFEANVN